MIFGAIQYTNGSVCGEGGITCAPVFPEIKNALGKAGGTVVLLLRGVGDNFRIFRCPIWNRYVNFWKTIPNDYNAMPIYTIATL